jgi:Questin oxidase-like
VQPDQLDAALTLLADHAPEFGPRRLSNHGPMVAEVLGHVGRPEAIAPWVARYRTRLSPAPPPADRPLSEEAWPGALGQRDRFPEWLALFETELADRPTAAVVGEWVPRLVPGCVGAAGHGLIRTGHGLRALGAHDTAPRRLEVGIGLAYWASCYQELPGPPLLIGQQRVPTALAELPYLPEEAPRAGLISDRVAHVADIGDEFEQAVASLGFEGDVVGLLDELALGGARAFLANADAESPVALVHTVTLPMALELVLPWLSTEDHSAALGYAWQATAALHVAYAVDRHPPAGPPGDHPAAAALVDAALESGDEHAIKFTEALLRSHGRTGQPDLLRAAADASRRL